MHMRQASEGSVQGKALNTYVYIYIYMNKCNICGGKTEGFPTCDPCDSDTAILTYGSTERRKALDRLLKRLKG